MAERYSGEVKAEQSKVARLESAVEGKKETPKLQETLAKNHKTFFDTVYEANDNLDKAQYSLKDPDHLSWVIVAKEGLKTYLRTAADVGRQAFQKELEEKDGIGNELSSLEKQASSITEENKKLQESVPLFMALEQASSIYEIEGRPALAKVEAIQNDEKILPADKRKQILAAASDALEKISKAKRTVTAVGGYPDFLEELVADQMKPINESLEEMGKIRIYYERQDYFDQEDIKKYATFDEETGGFIFTKVFYDLPREKQLEKQQQIQINLGGIEIKIKSEIETETCSQEHEKSFFVGRTALLAGNYVEAKEKLLHFYNTESAVSPHTPENTARLEMAKDMLKQIAKMQLALAEQRLNALEMSIKSYFGDLKIGTHHDVALLNIQHMREVLEKANAMLETGSALTIEEVYQKIKEMKDVFEGSAIARFQDGFDGAHSIFDVLKTQQEIDAISNPHERKQRLLVLGKEAHELGMFELAKNYYEAAFQQEISEKAKVIKKEDFEAKMRKDSAFQAEFASKMKEWGEALREKFTNDWKAKNNNTEPTPDAWQKFDKTLAQEAGAENEKVFTSMVNDAYGKLLKTMVHKDFTNNPDLPHASEWSEAYGNTFVNLENFDTSWYEFWKFTEAEWNAKKYQYVMDLALIIMAAATAGTTASMVVGARAGLVEALGEAALTEAGQTAIKKGGIQLARFAVQQLGAREAAKHGIRTVAEFALESALFNATEGALNGMVKGDWTTYSSPEAFMKSWGRGAVMLAGCKIGAMGYTFAGGGAAKTLVGKGIDVLASTTVEVGTMQAVGVGMMLASGEPLTQEKFAAIMRENVVMSLGLKGAHALSEPLSAQPESPSHHTELSDAMRRVTKTADEAETMEKLRKIGIEKPDQIKDARIDSEGKVIINGEVIPDITVKNLDLLPQNIRNRIKVLFKQTLTRNAVAQTANRAYKPAPSLKSKAASNERGFLTKIKDFFTFKEAIPPAVLEKQIEEAAAIAMAENAIAPEYETSNNPATGKPWTRPELLAYLQNRVEIIIHNYEYQLQRLSQALKSPYQPLDSSNGINPETQKPWTSQEKINYLKDKVEKAKHLLILDGNDPAIHKKVLELKSHVKTVIYDEDTQQNDPNIIRFPGINGKYEVVGAVENERLPPGWMDDVIGDKNFSPDRNFVVELKDAQGNRKYKIIHADDVADPDIGPSLFFGSASDPDIAIIRGLHADIANSNSGQRHFIEHPHQPFFDLDYNSLNAKLDGLRARFKDRATMSAEEKASWKKEIQEVRELIQDRQQGIKNVIGMIEKNLRGSAQKNSFPRNAEEIIDKLFDVNEMRKLFSPNEIQRIKQVTEEMLAKTKTIQRYFNEYANKPAELFRLLFGVEPKGKVELVHSDFSIGIVCYNLEDYKVIDPIPNAHKSGGVSLSLGRIPLSGLDGIVVAVNKSTIWDIDYTADFIKHEEQHNLNRAFFAGLRPESSLSPNPETVFDGIKESSILEKYLKLSLQQAQDEIIAFMAEGRPQAQVQDALLDPQGLYNYWGDNSFIQKHIEDLLNYAVATNPHYGKAKDRLDEVKQNFQKLMPTYAKKHAEMVGRLVKAGYALHDPALLATTSPTEWLVNAQKIKP